MPSGKLGTVVSHRRIRVSSRGDHDGDGVFMGWREIWRIIEGGKDPLSLGDGEEETGIIVRAHGKVYE